MPSGKRWGAGVGLALAKSAAVKRAKRVLRGQRACRAPKEGIIMRCITAMVTSLLLLAFPLVGSAQVGVKSGMSFGDVSNSGLLPGDVGRRSGFTVGVSAFTPGPVGLGVEGLYSQRGVSSQAGAQSRELEYVVIRVLLCIIVP
jgi:hypothetical protein